MEQLSAAAAGLGPVARAGMGFRAAELAQLIAAAGVDARIERITTPLQVGFFSYRLLDALQVRSAEQAALAALSHAAARLPAGSREAAHSAIVHGFERLRAGARRYVDQQFRQRNLGFMQELAVSSLSHKPLSQLSDAEVDSLRAEVARLARVLRARVAARRRVDRRGRLDLSRTLRRSLATGGVPVELVWRRRRRRKPRLVVLCDISDSVRTVSRFMLQLVYLLHELFDRVVSFAFVAELGELTELFKRYELERALALIASGKAVNVFASSNYGRALEQFARRHMSKITPRTTVLILGDGRNNFHASRACVVAQIRQRAKQLWWLTPESPAAWGFGDSAMDEYAPHCDRVVVASTVHTLRRVIDELVL